MQNLILKSLFLWSKSSVEDMISCLNFVIVWAWAMPMGVHCIFSSFGLGVLCRLIVHLDSASMYNCPIKEERIVGLNVSACPF